MEEGMRRPEGKSRGCWRWTWKVRISTGRPHRDLWIEWMRSLSQFGVREGGSMENVRWKLGIPQSFPEPGVSGSISRSSCGHCASLEAQRKGFGWTALKGRACRWQHREQQQADGAANCCCRQKRVREGGTSDRTCYLWWRCQSGARFHRNVASNNISRAFLGRLLVKQMEFLLFLRGKHRAVSVQYGSIWGFLMFFFSFSPWHGGCGQKRKVTG